MFMEQTVSSLSQRPLIKPTAAALAVAAEAAGAAESQRSSGEKRVYLSARASSHSSARGPPPPAETPLTVFNADSSSSLSSSPSTLLAADSMRVERARAMPARAAAVAEPAATDAAAPRALTDRRVTRARSFDGEGLNHASARAHARGSTLFAAQLDTLDSPPLARAARADALPQHAEASEDDEHAALADGVARTRASRAAAQVLKAPGEQPATIFTAPKQDGLNARYEPPSRQDSGSMSAGRALPFSSSRPPANVGGGGGGSSSSQTSGRSAASMGDGGVTRPVDWRYRHTLAKTHAWRSYDEGVTHKHAEANARPAVDDAEPAVRTSSSSGRKSSVAAATEGLTLVKLCELRQRGLLTQVEFVMLKAAIMQQFMHAKA
ncbi:hypothetical protein KFE25_014169 [Diacronema lutheri]|uniref:Uncharacterized protein n=1 Tax=Diacronema lutheri TaxID=2081491 RepID=A0A8J6C3H2_DIALT|nr:hypothetical protein KFE25_014169 [Diacronema lutheri]